MFIDQVTIEVAAGDGGSGRTAFRREIYYPKGGPSGGDGGRGGSVYAVGEPNLWTLPVFTYRKKWHAGQGESGGTSQRTGKSAEDLVIPVPLVTVFRDVKSGEI